MIDRIAAAPISWGICEVPGWGLQMSPSRVLGEMADLGITSTELGALGWLPDDTATLHSLLDVYGMSILTASYRWCCTTAPIIPVRWRPRMPQPPRCRAPAARTSSPR